MAITQTPAGWTFTHGRETYGPYPTRQAAQEAAYDVERGQTPPPIERAAISPLRQAARWFDTHHLVGGLALPNVTAQLAAMHPAETSDDYDILDVTLPTGETIVRHTSDGAPADWITVIRGDAEIDVEDGQIVSMTLNGDYIDHDLTDDLLDDLRALLGLDRAQLYQIAAMGPEVAAAREAWLNLPNGERRHLSRTVGFAAWLHDPNRPCEPLPEKEEAATPPLVELPTPVAPVREVSFDGRIGYALGGLAYAIRRLDADRAEQMLALIDQLSDARGDALTAAVDRLLCASIGEEVVRC